MEANIWSANPRCALLSHISDSAPLMALGINSRAFRRLILAEAEPLGRVRFPKRMAEPVMDRLLGSGPKGRLHGGS